MEKLKDYIESDINEIKRVLDNLKDTIKSIDDEVVLDSIYTLIYHNINDILDDVYCEIQGYEEKKNEEVQ